MADECEDGEWLDYSSCLGRQSSPSDPANEDGNEEVPEENVQVYISGAEKLEEIREVLKRTLCDTSQCKNLPFPQEIPSISQINGPCDNWIWLKLLSQLNSVRQPKWNGSCLEDYYNQCLLISKNTIPKESSQITLDHFAKKLFDFHGMIVCTGLADKELPGETNENIAEVVVDSENQLVNEKELQCRDNLSSLNSTGELMEKHSLKSDSTLEDFGPELEWSDNDIKGEPEAGTSSVASEFDESEAAADLARMSWREIINLRNELQAYTKQYSDILVVELENRDKYIREKELKNDFISSFLAVQAKIREASLMQNKKKFSLQSKPSSTSQSLMTIIPYEIQNGGPGPEILEKLTEIMEAMRTDSPDVPTLLTNYILKVLCK